MPDHEDPLPVEREFLDKLEGEEDAAELILELAPFLPPEMLPAALEVTKRVEDPLRRFLILITIVKRGVGSLPKIALSMARDSAEGITNREQRTHALLALAGAVRGQIQFAILLDALALQADDQRIHREMAERISHSFLRLRNPEIRLENATDALELVRTMSQTLPDLYLLEAEVPFLSERRVVSSVVQTGACLLAHVARKLSPEQLPEAFRVARQMPNETALATALVGIAPMLSPELSLEALSTARNISSPGPRARALIEFLPLVKDSQLKAVVSEEALAAAPAIVHWNTQAASFRKLNIVIPNSLVSNALETELRLERTGVQTRALASLSPRLNLEQLRETASIAKIAVSHGSLLLLRAVRDRAELLDSAPARALVREINLSLADTINLSEDISAGLRRHNRVASSEKPYLGEEDLMKLWETARKDSDRRLVALVEQNPAVAAQMAAPLFARSARVGVEQDISAVRPRSNLPVWPKRPEHMVSTGFSETLTVHEPCPLNLPLRPDQHYLFWLEIGAPAEGSIEENPTELPVDLLPADAELEVVLLACDPALVLEGSSRGVLLINAAGTARIHTPAYQPALSPGNDLLLERRLFFKILTPKTEGAYRLRCSIFFRCVLVQSREVMVSVSAGQEAREGSLRSRLDYTISRSLSPADLSDYLPHKMTIMVNDAADGSHNFHFVGVNNYQKSARFDTAELQDMISSLRKPLRIASWGSEEPWQPERFKYRYGEGADFDQLFRDLHAMAVTGLRHYDNIADRLGGGPVGAEKLREEMRTPGLLQIALRQSARQVVPLALIYDYPLEAQRKSNDCRLCDQFMRSVGENVPLDKQDCFTGNCPNYEDLSVVCPGGFWGFRHALGIPVSLLPEADSPPNVPAKITPSDPVQMAVAVCTDETLKKRLEHVSTLRVLLPPDRFYYAENYSETIRLMKMIGAQVFYFYCHGGIKDNVPFIQVGAMTDLGIERSTLRTCGIRWAEPRPRPLIFVNGCHTVDVEPEVSIEMVSGFTGTAGASAVIGTEITIFEDLAVDFGQNFLNAFLVSRDSLGSAVRSSRLAILQKQLNPLGLVYVPFGLPSLRL